MNLIALEEILKNEPNYRLNQIKKAIFIDLIEDWNEVTTLPVFLRQILKEKCPLLISGENFISKDSSTIKAVITLKDGKKVETVLMKHKDRNTICVSSQIGCPLGCIFCATGRMGFIRNLNTGEIVSQVLYFARLLKSYKDKVTNIVFMGMGEPFLNYNNVIKAVRILNDDNGFNLGIRRFSISTCGIIEGIEKLSKERLDINLAISLHAANDVLRSKLMPVNKKYPLDIIIKSVKEYINKTRRKVMFEYILFDGINDHEKDAKELSRLLKGMLCMVNLIVYNSTGIFSPSSVEKVNKFQNILEKEGLEVTKRYSFGQDIDAACGQLIINN